MHAAPADIGVPLRSVTWPQAVVATTLAGLIVAVITALTVPNFAVPAVGSTGQQRYPSHGAPSEAAGTHQADPAWSASGPQLGAVPPGVDASDPPGDPSTATTDDPTATPDPSGTASPSPSDSPSGTAPSPSASPTSNVRSTSPPQRGTTGPSTGHRSRTSAPRRLLEEQPPAGGIGGGVRAAPAPAGTPSPTGQPAPAGTGTATGSGGPTHAAQPDSGVDGALAAISRPLILSGLTGLLIAAVGLLLVSWRRRQW